MHHQYLLIAVAGIIFDSCPRLYWHESQSIQRAVAQPNIVRLLGNIQILHRLGSKVLLPRACRIHHTVIVMRQIPAVAIARSLIIAHGKVVSHLLLGAAFTCKIVSA